MEIIAVLIMIAAGSAIAVFALIAFALSKNEPARQARAASNRDEIAASILYQVLVAGGSAPADALRDIRRHAHLGARVTEDVDVSNWAVAFSSAATETQRRYLLEAAVRLVAQQGKPVPVLQYCALLDLSFGLGFQTDALARLRDEFGFEYVDHAKSSRPRHADRAGGATPLFVRDDSDRRECLRVLEIEGNADRQTIISAYRRLAARHHPDKLADRSAAAQESAAARFIEITRAYERLMATFRD